MLAIAGCCSRSDDGGRPLRRLIEPRRPPRPQPQRRRALWLRRDLEAAERGEGQRRPLVVVGRDQPTTAASEQFEIGCSRVDFASSFGVSRQDVTDLTPSHPFGGLYRPHPIYQGGEFSAGWLDHAGQVGPCAL